MKCMLVNYIWIHDVADKQIGYDGRYNDPNNPVLLWKHFNKQLG